MTREITFTGLDEAGLTRLAELAAFSVRPGDLIALTGDLGAGKTTLARAFLQALSHPHLIEVPSPTFTLVQTYDTPRLKIAHFDLYRLIDPVELDELGFDDVLINGAALVEWPDRAGGRLTGVRLDIAIAEPSQSPDRRDVTLTGHGSWAGRVGRMAQIHAFLTQAGYGSHAISYLQGDASMRRYARLRASDGSLTILMDWPRQPDGPPIRDGMPYSRIAHLAEDVGAFAAIANALLAAGFSAPSILAQDLDHGLLIIEDFGDLVFGATSLAQGNQPELWRMGVDALVALRDFTPPLDMGLPGGTTVTMPVYDAQAFGIETELLLDWYWPALHGSPAPDEARADYLRLWAGIFARLRTLPQGWALRDYHSPNLLLLRNRPAPRNVGIIDFQDAQIGPHAYDLVSLLQDARVDVPADLEAALLTRYCDAVAARDPAFQRPSFLWSYAALGAQRNSKILGIFARLAHRDGKPQYLAHIPRIWGYLARDLAHLELAALAEWYTQAFPPALRQQTLTPTRAKVLA